MNTLRSLMAGILMLLALITAPVMALAAFSNAIDPDLVGLWHMDGDWVDSSGNGNHGGGSNGAAFSANRKVGNYAGSFDGVDDYVNVPDAASLDITDNITIEAWIYPKADHSGYAVHLINKWGVETTTANYVLYYFGTISGTNRQIGFFSNAGGVWKAISPRYTMSLNNWYHVVLSYSAAGGGYLYVNGVSQGPPVGSGSLKTNTYPLRFGSSGDGAAFNGLIDDVTIYKRALAGEEIAANYAAVFRPAPPLLGPVHSAVGTSTIALTGTSALNTSIWVNNKMIAVTDASGNWAGTYGTLQPGTNILNITALDSSNRLSEPVTVNVLYDMTPPVLAISTLSDGAYTNNEILNIAGTVTDDTGVTGVTVNDTAVQVNADGSFSYALLLKNGVNIMTIAATDSAGNIAAETRTVTLDQTAPILAVTTPADNSKTGKLLLEVSGAVDETSAVTVKLKGNIQSAIMNGGAFTATLILEPGYNTIEIIAVDLAGNRSTLKRTVVFDDQVPSLAVTVPSQDIRTNQSSLTIKGAVHDDLTAVGVTISKDNEILTLPVIDGTFEQVVNFTEEKTYGIVVTATNEVGTSTSVQRNVIYDITPPVLGIDPVATPTGRPSLSLTGTREGGTVVTVTCATATVGEVSYPTATTWQVHISGLREGENVITAESADAAGNAVTATATAVLVSRPPEITITTTPDVIWPPNHKMVPVTIAGGVETYGSDIKSVAISVSDEYGKIEYNKLAFGSTVMLEAWRKGNDKAGRKYTITVVVTDNGGISTAKAVTVTVPHNKPKLKKIVHQPVTKLKK